MKFGLIVPGADVAVEAPHVRRREIAVAVVVQSFERAIDGEVTDLFAPLRRTLDAPERAAHRIDLSALIAEAILHLNVDGAAQRVQAESRIVGHHGDRLDGGGRNQIPVDGVAKRLVDPYAVLIDRQPLGRAGYRRGNEAAKLHVGLERIACHFGDDDARYIFYQSVADVQRSGLLDLVGVDDIDAGGRLVGLDVTAGQRRCRIDHDGGYGANPAGRLPVAATFNAGLCLGDRDRRQSLRGLGRSLGLRPFTSGKQAYR